VHSVVNAAAFRSGRLNQTFLHFFKPRFGSRLSFKPSNSRDLFAHNNLVLEARRQFLAGPVLFAFFSLLEKV
jgi:hypothetical protein